MACSFSSRPTKVSKTHSRPPLPHGCLLDKILRESFILEISSRSILLTSLLIHDSRPRHSGTTPPPGLQGFVAPHLSFRPSFAPLFKNLRLQPQFSGNL